MKFIHFNHLRCIFFFLLLGGDFTTVYADIPYTDLKGVHQWIKPEYQAFSPVIAYGLSETFENYRFLGNYGPKVAAHGCMDRVRQYREGFVGDDGNRILGLVERQDCPQDFNTEWLQRLFPSVDGEIFAENGAKRDLISHLSPFTIGQLIERIAKQPDSSYSQESQNQALEVDFKNILFQGLDPDGFRRSQEKQNLKKAIDDKKLKQSSLRQKMKNARCLPEQKTALGNELKQLDLELAQLVEKTSLRSGSPDSGSSTSDSDDEKTDPSGSAPLIWSEKNFTDVAKILVGALKESHDETSSYSKGYPKDFPAQELILKDPKWRLLLSIEKRLLMRSEEAKI